MKQKSIYLFLILLTSPFLIAQNNQQLKSEYLKSSWGKIATRMDSDWYATDVAKHVAEYVLMYQNEIGGWEKNQPYHRLNSDSLKTHFLQTEAKKHCTFDNGSTITELRFLAKVHSQSNDNRYKEAFVKGINYILIAQYENGGWPQYYPAKSAYDEIIHDNTRPYSFHITYNDNAMVNVMLFLKDILSDNEEFSSLKINKETKGKAKKAFDKGIDCILKTQIRINNKPTVWCAQHNKETLAPANARTYELASFSGSESVGVTQLLMDIDNPSKSVITAVKGAVEWFEINKIEGIRLETKINIEGKRDRIIVEDIKAPPIWARFYDLDTYKPFFCSRDGIKRDSMDEISHERRNGYGWYTYAPENILKKYPEWKKKWDINNL